MHLSPADHPSVSVIIACRDVRKYIDGAIQSAQRQSMSDLEILIVDDCSVDGSLDIIEEYAAKDSRIRVLRGQGRGPAAARNLALALARGKWLAILDGDDLWHPYRLELMLKAGEASKAEILIDNCLCFEDGDTTKRPNLMVKKGQIGSAKTIDTASFIKNNIFKDNKTTLSYMKPILNREFIKLTNIKYREDLLVGEDHDILMRAMIGGAKMYWIPAPFYYYRRRATSISAKVSREHLDAMIKADEDAIYRLPQDDRLYKLTRERIKSINRHIIFGQTISNIDSKRFGPAIYQLTSNPSIWRLILRAIRIRIRHRITTRTKSLSVTETHYFAKKADENLINSIILADTITESFLDLSNMDNVSRYFDSLRALFGGKALLKSISQCRQLGIASVIKLPARWQSICVPFFY